MAFIMEFFDGLAKDENDETMQTMSKLYGPFLHWSLVFPLYNHSELPKTLLNLAFAAVAMLSHLYLLLATVWMERFDLELASLVFHYAVIVFFYLTVLFCMNVKRTLNSENHSTLAQSWGNYQPGNIYEENNIKQIQKVLDRELLMFLAIPGGVSVAAGMALLIPYILHYDETRITVNGVNRNLLIPCYYPFPTEHGLWHIFTLGIQGAVILLIAFLVITMLLTFLRVSMRVRFEYKVATYALQTLFSRAAELYKQTCAIHGISEIDEDDQAYQNCIGLCLKDVVIHHHTIVDLAGRFDSISCWPLALAFLLGTGVIGLSLINILSALKGENYEYVAIFSLLLVGEVANIFTLCVIGEAITTDSETFHEQLYFIEWDKLNIPNRRILLNLQVGAHQPYVMVAAGLVDSNHDTFSSIINSAYSFFNLVNVS